MAGKAEQDLTESRNSPEGPRIVQDREAVDEPGRGTARCSKNTRSRWFLASGFERIWFRKGGFLHLLSRRASTPGWMPRPGSAAAPCRPRRTRSGPPPAPQGRQRS
eukprot:181842-Rhodomonas_salina.1